MSGFVHYDLDWQPAGAVVEVTLRERANVRLVDSANFRAYRSGRSFRAIGGRALRSPLRLEVPHGDHWHVVIDLGGAAGRIHSDVRVFAGAA